jgi:hypothetical protein
MFLGPWAALRRRSRFFILEAAMNEPTKIVRGLSLTWTESLSDYKASDGWTLKYSLSNSSANTTLTSTADGDDHVITLTTAGTTALALGTSTWISYVDDGTDKYQIATGVLTVQAAIGTSVDRRTHAKKMLDAIEAVLESRATREQEELTIAGRSIKYMSLEQLIKARGHYEYLVKQEASDEIAAQGGSVGNQILVEFK